VSSNLVSEKLYLYNYLRGDKNEKWYQYYQTYVEFCTSIRMSSGPTITFFVEYKGNKTEIKAQKTIFLTKALQAACDKFGLNHQNYVLSKEGIQIDERKNTISNNINNFDTLTIEKYVESEHGKMYSSNI
jgi:hypothetical protein